MEHIFFEVQLCIQKSIFNEFCGILGIWQIGCRVASLHRNLIGPPEGIEVRDFNRFLDFFENLNFGRMEIVDMDI